MAAGRWAGLDRYAGALVLEQVLSPGRQQQTQKKKHGQEKQPQQPPPLPVPGEGYESWRPVWERTRVSVIWRGQPLMDGRLSKEADCEQIHRDSVLALFEEVAAANEKLAAGQVVRHELFIVGADGRAYASLV